MTSDREASATGDSRPVELVRVQPIEAEVVAARLRAAGFDVTLGPDPVYESVGFADGVPVFVAANELQAALAVLKEGPEDPGGDA
jgi:hypothetical protein